MLGVVIAYIWGFRKSCFFNKKLIPFLFPLTNIYLKNNHLFLSRSQIPFGNAFAQRSALLDAENIKNFNYFNNLKNL